MLRYYTLSVFPLRIGYRLFFRVFHKFRTILVSVLENQSYLDGNMKDTRIWCRWWCTYRLPANRTILLCRWCLSFLFSFICRTFSVFLRSFGPFLTSRWRWIGSCWRDLVFLCNLRRVRCLGIGDVVGRSWSWDVFIRSFCIRIRGLSLFRFSQRSLFSF